MVFEESTYDSESRDFKQLLFLSQLLMMNIQNLQQVQRNRDILKRIYEPNCVYSSGLKATRIFVIS